MAARILSGALLLRKCGAGIVHKQITPQCFWRSASLQPIVSRLLHVRVSDAEAGLDKQREQNQQNLNDTSHDNHNMLEQPPMEHLAFNGAHKTNDKIKRTKAFRSQEFTVPNSNVKDDADFFGNAATAHEKELIDDDDDDDTDRVLTRRAKKLRNIDYARTIKDHLRVNQLKAAIDVLEKRMLKEDGAKPDNYIYNLLISGCAKAGYTQKAFSLFTKMRQRGLHVKGGVYTSLFNACANAPSAAEGLERANRVREIMLEKSYEPNEKNYNAMIKAYGRCGDVKTAYMLADEMMERQLPMNVDTFNFLMQACASDKEFGFRHCLLTWHKMLKRNLQPDYYTFNLVLRCTRDCGFGDLPTMQQLLQQILKERRNMQIDSNVNANQLQIESEERISLPAHAEHEQEPKAAAVQVFSERTQLEIPNLLATRPHLGSMVSLGEVRQAHDRFLLLGGLTGFLDLMKQNGVTPNIQTFTTMLEVIPPTNAAEKQVLMFIRKIGLKADIDFFNILIKKRSMRYDYEGGKEVLSMIRTAGLKPDIVTYGVLALGCRTVDEARELLLQMHQYDIRMNIQILGAMLRQGCAQKAFPYVVDIMQISLDENIRPNDFFLRHLHNFYVQCARAIDSRHPSTKTNVYKRNHAKFCEKYRIYQEEHGIAGLKIDDAIKKIKGRPYAQYKEETIDGIEPVKNEKLAKQRKLRKYIKKIKIDSLRADKDDGSEGDDDNAAGGTATTTTSAQSKSNLFRNNTKQLL